MNLTFKSGYSNTNPFIIMMHTFKENMNLYRYSFRLRDKNGNLTDKRKWLYLATTEPQHPDLAWNGLILTELWNSNINHTLN